MRIIECVPNVSEGRNFETIELLANAIQTSPNVTLLHVSSNPDANRTVYTFAGSPLAVHNAAYRLVQLAVDRIDMTTQKGAHTRNGAVDVCPLVPVKGVSMQECVQYACKLGRQIGDLGIPVFLYAEAASNVQRTQLSHLRKGQYEALKSKLKNPAWYPDFGPAKWNDHVAKSGSIQIGARPFLIAFNVNLKTTNVKIAKSIARRIRTSGYQKTPGEFSALKADGWYMNGYKCAQVTMNFTDFTKTSLHEVIQRIASLAQSMGTEINGAELIGLVPKQALLDSGHFFMRHSNFKPTTAQLIDSAVTHLGLGMGPSMSQAFVAQERILELQLNSLQL